LWQWPHRCPSGLSSCAWRRTSYWSQWRSHHSSKSPGQASGLSPSVGPEGHPLLGYQSQCEPCKVACGRPSPNRFQDSCQQNGAAKISNGEEEGVDKLRHPTDPRVGGGGGAGEEKGGRKEWLEEEVRNFPLNSVVFILGGPRNRTEALRMLVTED